jgi:hypothetical protein
MKLPLIGLALILIASCSSTKAQLLLNGNFSTGDFTDWTVQQASPGSAYVSSAYVGPNGLFPGTTDTVWFAGSTPFTYISQSFASTAGTTYQLSFAVETYGSPNEFLANIGGTFNLAIQNEKTTGGYANFITGGTTYDTNNSSTDSWSQITLDYTATGPTTEVTFGAFNANDTGVDYLADVSASTTTPEPSTWALLLGGVGLLAFWRKHLRQGTGLTGGMKRHVISRRGRPAGCDASAGEKPTLARPVAAVPAPSLCSRYIRMIGIDINGVLLLSTSLLGKKGVDGRAGMGPRSLYTSRENIFSVGYSWSGWGRSIGVGSSPFSE